MHLIVNKQGYMVVLLYPKIKEEDKSSNEIRALDLFKIERVGNGLGIYFV